MTKVFIDGSAGTTGLRIHDRLKNREDINLLTIDYEKRHNIDLRREALNEADIVFLCLPDDAAIESVSLIDGKMMLLSLIPQRLIEYRLVGFMDSLNFPAKEI